MAAEADEKFKAEQKLLGLSDSSDDDELDESEGSDRPSSSVEPARAQEAPQFDENAKFKAEQQALGLSSSDDDNSDESGAAGSDQPKSSVEPPRAQEAPQFDERVGQLEAEMDNVGDLLAQAVQMDEDYAEMAAELGSDSAMPGASQAEQELEALL